jgi:GT2 family glycosyltransferase
MMTNGHVKIIIPCTNEGEWLRVTVDSILDHTDYPSFQIVVSANGDRVTDFSFVEGPGYGQVGLHWTERALGVGNARNVAAVPGDAAFYVFLDSHCLLGQPDWLRRAVECLERYPAISMVQPEVAAFVHENEIRPGEKMEASQVRARHYEYGTRWAWPYGEAWQVVDTLTLKRSRDAYEEMSGAGMAIFTRAETFHRLGKFDSEVQGWFHETMDFCVRAWMLGYPMMVEPNVRVYHRGKMKPPDYARSSLQLFHGTLRTAYKYLSPRRRDLAEIMFRKHGHDLEVDAALGMVRSGQWLAERVRHLRDRVHDDDWLFSKFAVYEERFSGFRPTAPRQPPRCMQHP